MHPYIENYIFTIENIQPVLAAVRERNLPVLVHTDDRKPSLSRGKLLASVAKEFHDVTFILAHCGSYAPGKLDLPGESWVRNDLIIELVSEAIQVAWDCPNVFLETSILASTVKAKLIAQNAPLEKLLIGTDFPIYKPVFGSVVFQENALLQAGMSYAQIDTIHQNARLLFRRSA